MKSLESNKGALGFRKDEVDRILQHLPFAMIGLCQHLPDALDVAETLWRFLILNDSNEEQIKAYSTREECAIVDLIVVSDIDSNF
jgi:hypothetical protein